MQYFKYFDVSTKYIKVIFSFLFLFRPLSIPAPNFDQDEDILTLANRLLALHQKVITLESKINRQTEPSFTGTASYYFKIFGISLAAALLVQFLSKR